MRGAIEKNGEADDEKRSERNEKAISVGGNSGPVRIAGNKEIKSKKSREKRCADARFAAPEKKEANDREKKNGRPSQEAVIGREKDGEKYGRTPEPVAEGSVAGFERATVNDEASDENGQQTEKHDNAEENMTDEKFRSAGSGGGAGRSGVSKRGEVLGQGFNKQDGEEQGIGVVDVEHESGDRGEDQPLREPARGTRAVPVPKEQGDSESGVRVRPRRIEIHINGEGAGPPNGDGGKKGPAFFDILASEAEGEEQTEESVNGGGERHGDAIRGGKTVRGDGGAQRASQQDGGVGEEEEGSPEDGRASGEMVFEMAGGSAKFEFGLAGFVEARPAKTFVGVLIIPGEIETVLNERCAGKGVIANAITAHPRIEKG